MIYPVHYHLPILVSQWQWERVEERNIATMKMKTKLFHYTHKIHCKYSVLFGLCRQASLCGCRWLSSSFGFVVGCVVFCCLSSSHSHYDFGELFNSISWWIFLMYNIIERISAINIGTSSLFFRQFSIWLQIMHKHTRTGNCIANTQLKEKERESERASERGQDTRSVHRHSSTH